MRVVCNKKPMPKRWKAAFGMGEELLLERDLRIGSLFLKLLVFSTPERMRRFWNRCPHTRPGGKLERGALGVVSPLSCEFRDYSKTNWPNPVMEVDRRYFCAVGLSRHNLGTEVLTHEGAHAAFAYAKRTRARSLWAAAMDGLEEEWVCYPAGRINRMMVDALYKAGLYS